MWYSPYCTPDTGATGLWLPGNAVAQNCPAAAPWCVGGLGPKPKRVHPALNGGYDHPAPGPFPWNAPFKMEKNPSTGQEMPGTPNIYRAKVVLNPDDPSPVVVYCNLVQIKVPKTTIPWQENGNPIELELEAVTIVGGWQVKAPPAVHAHKYTEGYLVEPLENGVKVIRVGMESEEGEAIITEVVLHKDTIMPLIPEKK